MTSETPNSVNRLNIDYSEEYLKSDEYLNYYLSWSISKSQAKIEQNDLRIEKLLTDLENRHGKEKAREIFLKKLEEAKREFADNRNRLEKSLISSEARIQVNSDLKTIN